MSDFIKPEQVAETEYVVDESTGEVIREIEHFRQGDRYYRIVHEKTRVVPEDASQNPVRTFATADLVEALMSEGIWPDVRAWIESQGLLDLVLATKEFGEDNANFQAGKAALQAELGWTDAEVEALLAPLAQEV